MTTDIPVAEKQVSRRSYLPLRWLLLLVLGLCLIPAITGALATEIEGWPGLALWVLGWGIMSGVAWISTCKYANPMLPTLCGAMVGMTVPRPSDEWFQQFVREGWARAIGFGLSMLGVALGLAVFSTIAKRNRA